MKYWEIDNEMWEMGIEKYEKCVRRYSEEMRKIDPSIKIIACGGFQEDEEFINRSGNYFDYKDVYVAPNYQVTDLWYDHFSRYLLSYTGETGDLNVVTTLSEDSRSVIVKVVNPTEQAYTLTLNGTWKATAPATYDFFAPGDLMIGNTMDHKDAVALQHATVDPTGPSYNLSVAPYSAGVLTINLRTSLQ